MSSLSDWDFEGEPEELIGREVLFTISHGGGSDSRYIRKVVSVGKDLFQIEGTDVNFRISSGSKAGKRHRMDYASQYCKLLTTQEAQSLRTKWALDRLIKEKVKTIKEFPWDKHLDLVNEVFKLLPPH